MPRSTALAAVLAAGSAVPAWAGCAVTSEPLDPDEAAFVSTVSEHAAEYVKEFGTPGAAVAVIEDGRVILARGFGFADAARGVPVGPETLFNIGSTSKSVAAWGAMRLVEEGSLDLDAPVDSRLTRWHLPPSRFAATGVTLRRLLSHTAGLSVSGYRGWGPDDIVPFIEQSLSGQTNGAGALELVAEPGTAMSYSGGGYTLMQLLVEEASGKPFAEYMRDQVLRPLGMNDSSFSLTPSVLGRSSLAYDELGEETPTPRFVEVAAAGMYATINDMACYALASIGSEAGAAVASAATLDLMTSPAPATNGERGLGYSIQPAGSGFPDGVERVGHDGGNRGWQAFFWVGRGTKDGLVVLTNGSMGWNVSNQIVADWMEWKTGQRLPIPRSVAAVILRALHENGATAAIAQYRRLKANNASEYIWSPGELNRLGYALLRKGRVADAVALWELNAQEYPDDANVHDSLGDGYAASGPEFADRAVASFERSLALDPGNDHARIMIERIRRGDIITF